MSHDEFEYDDEQIDNALVRAVNERASNMDLDEIARGVIGKRLTEAADTIIGAHLEREIKSMFEQGWIATNRWGEEENHGRKVTLRDRIAVAMKEGSRYSNEGTTIADRIQSAVKKAVEAQVDKEMREFKKELKVWKNEKMTDKLRAALDGAIF